MNRLKVLTSLQVLFNLISSSTTLTFPFIYPQLELAAVKSNASGDPLILTQFLKNNSISLAQNLSRVVLTDYIGVESHAGFFTVDEKHNSNLYFWYFPPFSDKSEAPLILWLQGGPGGSSLFGLFTEVGPLVATKHGFALRKYHWALNYHLLFIDNPVGTGFSFTDNENGFCNDEHCVAKGLYSCIHQFFKLFPNLKDNEFYIAGESYAGKYIPSLAMEIYQQNFKNDIVNLKGLAIGNGYCDPVNQIDYGNYLYEHGLIDDNQLEKFLALQNQIVNHIKHEDWINANLLMAKLLDEEIDNSSYYQNFTGFTNYYNFLKATNTEDVDDLSGLLQSNVVRKSIHVGGLPFNSGDSNKVQKHLALDILKSVAPVISDLLQNYRIMFYNGQLDVIVAYPLTVSFLNKLHFNSANEYKKAQRHIWKVGDEIAGYYKKAGNLTEVLVRNAGHMVPTDQPVWALELITRFIRNNL